MPNNLEVGMKNTLEDFKTKTKRCEDVFEADRVCLVWLRLSCREYVKVVVFLEGIGNCDVRNVVSGKTCSLDTVGFDKTFKHGW